MRRIKHEQTFSKKSLTIKSQAIILVSLIILLLAGGFFYHAVKLENRLTQTIYEAENQQLQTILHNIIELTFVPYETRLANLLESHPEIVAAFANRDRNALYRYGNPHYLSLTRENQYLHVMHFHLPDSTTFLRMHFPDFFGDNLKGVRPIVDQVHRHHTKQNGFEVGRNGIFYRVVLPVTWQNSYIGAVELGIRAEQLIDAVQKRTDLPILSYLKQEHWQKATKVKDDSLIHHGEYVIKSWNATLTDLLSDNFLATEGSQLIERAGTYYHAHNYHLFTTFQGDPIGGIVLQHDVTARLLAQKSFWYRAVFSTLLVCLAALFILSFYFNKVFGSLFTEINRRQKAQLELAESSKKNLLLLNSTAEGIFGLDLNGKCTFVNSSFLSILGYESEEEFIGTSIHEKIHSRHADGSLFPREKCPMCLACRDGQQVEVDNEVLWRKDGTAVPVIYRAYPIFEEGKLVGLVITFIDISKRKKTEEEFKRLAVAVENTADKVIITDLDGVIQYVNPAFSSITGYSREEAVGRTPRFLKSGRHDDAYYQNMWDTLTRGEVWSDKIFNKSKDGAIIVEEGTISPIKDEKGIAIGYVSVKRNMTEQNELENRLQHAQKMEAIGTLAGGIAHDFNNLLNGILGFTNLSFVNLHDPGKLEGHLTQIKQASHRAAGLVKNILAFSRQGEEKRCHINLASVVQEAVSLLQGSLPATIEIHQEISNQCQTVYANFGMLHQVIMNLCTNAFHAMQHDIGTLTISLTPVEFSDNNQQKLAAGTYNLLSVADTGPGISPEHLDKIFDPYFTTKKQGEGTGLGLATVHGIITDHGGHISVQSDIGKGTTFQIYLPVSTADDCDTYSQEQKPENPSLPLSGHILFVDDVEMNVLLGQEILEGAGCQVTGMTDSVEAMELFASCPDTFDMVITDQTMPKLTGLEMSKKIVALRPELPIVVVTGYTDKKILQKLKNSSTTDILTKPIAIETLLAMARKYLPSCSPQQHHEIIKGQVKPTSLTGADILQPIREQDVKQYLAITYQLPEEQIAAMLESAKKSLPWELSRAQEAAADSDLGQLHRSAHTVKGLLLNMGVYDWAAKAYYLEKAALNNQEEEYELLVQELMTGIAAIIE